MVLSVRKFFANRWWLAIVLVLCAAVAWSFFGKRNSARGGAENRPVPVAVATAMQGDLPLFLGGLGTVTPANNVLVKSRVDGQLLRVHFQEGQLVHAGDLLAEIDPRPFQVQLLQAEGQLARDAALLKNAQLDLERYRTLWSQDSIAKQQVDAQEALVRQYEGTVQVDRGQVEDAKLQLVYANVSAPISGRVGLRQVDPGNMVHASDASGIVLITQVQPVNVVFTLPEDNLPRVAQKLTAKAALPVDVYDRQQKLRLASGTLLSADNQIDTATGTVKLKAQFRNDDSALFPNQFVNVRMQVDTLRGVVMVPVNAVQRGAQTNFVYLLNPDNSVKIQNVRVGDTEGDRVVIESGVRVGDQVVVEGIDKLRDGGAVEVVSRDGQLAGGDNADGENPAVKSADKPSAAAGKPKGHRTNADGAQ
jgi:multidrug efflux system membrane fusion protein